MKIMSAIGQVIHQQVIEGTSLNVDFKDHSSGMYYIQVKAWDKRLVKKLVKQ